MGDFPTGYVRQAFPFPPAAQSQKIIPPNHAHEFGRRKISQHIRFSKETLQHSRMPTALSCSARNLSVLRISGGFRPSLAIKLSLSNQYPHPSSFANAIPRRRGLKKRSARQYFPHLSIIKKATPDIGKRPICARAKKNGEKSPQKQAKEKICLYKNGIKWDKGRINQTRA